MKLLFNPEKTKNDKSGILWFREDMLKNETKKSDDVITPKPVKKEKWVWRVLRYSILALFIPGLSWFLSSILGEIFTWYAKLFKEQNVGILKYILVSIVIGIIIDTFMSNIERKTE